MTDFQFPKMNPIGLTLKAEGGAIAVICALAYAQLGGSMWLFMALVLVPDLFMIGYLAGSRLGALCYNIGHSYLTPIVVGGVGFWGDLQIVQLVALIWGVHIGLDRTIGYGLKYGTGFKNTHLNRV